MEKHLNAIWCHYQRLQYALNHAHSNNLISYDNYRDEAPCAAMDELKNRIQKTTAKAISDLTHGEIRRRYWKKRRIVKCLN